MPLAAIAPPANVVRRMPNLSVRIPATDEKKKVVPMVSEPTNAKRRKVIHYKEE